MNALKIIEVGNQDVIDSRDIAEAIDKRHDHLVRDIDSYIDDIDDSPDLGNGSATAISVNDFFIPSTYELSNGRKYRNYLVTQKGCEFIANKLTGKKGNQFTAAYVNAFNQMRIEIQNQSIYEAYPQIPRNYTQALRQLADSQEKLEKQKPKVEYYDSQMRNPGLMTATEIAKDYGWSAKTLNKELQKRHIIFKQGKHWVLYQKYSNKGYTQYEPFDYKDKISGKHGIRNNLKWTQKGRKFIYDILAKDDIRPIIERLDDNLIER